MSEYFEPNEEFFEKLAELMDDGAQYLDALLPDRPYDGQPQTDSGERGRTEVRGISFRDLMDCYVMACFQASGLPAVDYPRTVYELPWDNMDPMAIQQRMCCLVEERMRIYPNLGNRRQLDTPPNDPAKRYRSTLEAVKDLLQAMGQPHSDIEKLRDEAERIIWEQL